MFFQYRVDADITLELQTPFHARELFDVINESRDFIGEHLAWVNKIQHEVDIKYYMKRDLMGMAQERRWAWLIRYKGRAVGRIGILVTMPALQECELYYFLGKKYTGKGIITRATKTIVDYAVNVLRLKHILIGFSTLNPKSGAVAERLGFQYEYTMQDAEIHRREWRSLHFWGILAEDWQSTIAPAFSYKLDDDLSLQLYQAYQSDTQFKIIKANQVEFSQWFWWANERFTLAREKEIARKRLKRYTANAGLAVTVWQDESLIGNVSLMIESKHKSGSLSYWLDKDARGKGIMTRCVSSLLDEAFTNYKLQRLKILTASANTGSRALAERLGMQLELTQKDETLLQGKFVDHVQYRLLVEEWKEKTDDISHHNTD